MTFRCQSACVVLFLLLSSVRCTHFRGGTTRWFPQEGRQVTFNFKLGWAYQQKGPGCTEMTIGQFAAKYPMDWICETGCNPSKPVTMYETSYYCTAASKQENWEQGENSINYTFPQNGIDTFKVGFSGGTWLKLANGLGGGFWHLFTTVDLRTRSDTGRINASPLSLSKPIYHLKFGCRHQLHIPTQDPDNDVVRCRWAKGDECVSVCKALPNAVLDEEKCTILFDTTTKSGYKAGGYYAVALMVEDYPKASMTLNGKVSKTPKDTLSSIPVQFLIKTDVTGDPCNSIPRFISPTPVFGAVILHGVGDLVNIKLFADNGNDKKVKVQNIGVIGPSELIVSPVKPDPKRPKTYMAEITWQTTLGDVGLHLICASVTNTKGIIGKDRCFTIKLNIDECRATPCQNGAKCTNANTVGGGFTCTCLSGYTGSTCSTDINECNPNPCKNGANCTDRVNDYTCTCHPGYSGKNCETDINECSPNPCQNGANCTDKVNDYTCLCVPGYTGGNCQTDINECNPNPCQNGANCTDKVNNYTCTCVSGYTGRNCQTDINECNPNPCQNGANCTDKVNNYICTCILGYTGRNCQTEINECKPNPCQNRAMCVDKVNDYTCTCHPGYSGKNCETDINECNLNPCQNGANCTDKVNDYTCTCVSGYSGGNCQTEINECKPNPCQNRARCDDKVNDYTCTCHPGYSGKNCETDINECSPNPCQNGANCTDKVNNYTCTCVPGYTGGKCQKDINECSPNPCQNGANCTDKVNNYTCTCVPGYTGENCQTVTPVTTQNDVHSSCPKLKYDGCYCSVGAMKGQHLSGLPRSLRDFLAGLVGFPIGLGFSLATYGLILRCLKYLSTKHQVFKSTKFKSIKSNSRAQSINCQIRNQVTVDPPIEVIEDEDC